MATKASTHRFDPQVQTALDHLSKVLRRPKNRLINEAVQLYVEQKSREVEQELESTLMALRAYRQKDPDFTQSMEDFVNAEAALETDDPLEGVLHSPENSTGMEIQRLLHA